jgi:hypothetical protein
MSEEKQIEGLGELKNGLEALVNVLYLIREDRKNPDQVLRWDETADVQTERMAQVLTADASSGVMHRGSL